jgi:DUF4097 and DUF4098 domain-containing protein YvlB
VAPLSKLLIISLFAVLLSSVSSAPALADHTDTVSKTFRVNPGGTLYLKTTLGKITVRPGNGTEVTVVIRETFRADNSDEIEDIRDDLDIDMDSSGNDVTIITEYKYGKRGFFFSHSGRWPLRLEYDIVVPETYNVDLKTSDEDVIVGTLTGSVRCATSDGDIDIKKIDGPVTAKTSDGDINLVSSSGDAELKTSDGDIALEYAGGNVTASTSDGDILVKKAIGPLTARTSDGDIVLADVAESFDASTSDGNISVAITRQPTDNSSISTSDGDIDVRVNPVINLSFNVRTSDSRIDAGTLSFRVHEMSKKRFVADLNGGGPGIDIRTSDGNVRLHGN